jgi:hypothetical protein
MRIGKWYCEFTPTAGANNMVGLQNSGAIATTYVGGNANSWGYYQTNGNKYNNNSASSYGASYTTGDVVGIAFDADNGTLAFYKNGTSQGTAYSGLSANETYFFAVGNGGGSFAGTFNFGQRPFAYTAPSGFKALCSSNLPAPLITKPNTVFDVALWTGNSGTQSITLPGGFSPDLVWGKTRSAATYYHVLYDTVRGTGPTKSLYSNATDAEGAQSIYTNLTSFDSTGFSLGSTSPNNNILNQSGQTFVGWCWDAGSSTVTNTQGSITNAQVRASTTAGFSVISYVGTGSAGASIGHGLGVAPAFALFKNRSVSSDWQVYHVSLGNAQSILLQSTAAAGSSSAFNSTSPTSTIITLGAGTSLNSNGSNHICYAWAPVVGYSSMGSYVGNGSSDGTFVYTGFRPRWILIKNTSSTLSWILVDTARGTTNGVGPYLFPNVADQESATGVVTDMIDILSNGFKLRANYTSTNSNGNVYIYFALAESPFNYARAR